MQRLLCLPDQVCDQDLEETGKNMQHFLFRIFPKIYRLSRIFRGRFTSLGTLLFFVAVLSAAVGFNVRVNLGGQVFAFLSSIFVVSGVLSLSFRGRFAVERELPAIATVGESFDYSVKIKNLRSCNEAGLELYDRLEDLFPDFATYKNSNIKEEKNRNAYDRVIGYHRWLWVVKKLRGGISEYRQLPLIPHNDNINITLNFTPLKRGYINFSAIDICRNDPFGLIRARKTIKKSDSLLVLPKRYPVPTLDLGGGSLYQIGGVVLSSSLGESEEFVSLRDYRPGDSLRSIHWKSFAKTGRPVIRETQPEYFTRNALILDTMVDCSDSHLFEEAISVAASFLCSFDLKETLLDLIFVGDKSYKYTAGRGVATQNSLLKVVACAQRAENCDFRRLYSAVIPCCREISGAILVLVELDKSRQELIDAIRSFGVAVKVFVITKREDLKSSDSTITFLPVNSVVKALKEVVG